ncbi:MAG: hypothetical protein M5U08_16445 [Burkholderiales bacterium]|nr:hypothetical protein [Burkholderiales bacterium]
MKLNLERGLFRIWLLASIAWVGIVLSENAFEIGRYFGYHYELFSRAQSFRAALTEKNRMARISSLCREARDMSCRYEQVRCSATQLNLFPNDCTKKICDDDKYVSLAGALLQQNGLPDGDPKACNIFLNVHVPKLTWDGIFVLLGPILGPLLLWYTGRWVARGFRS